MACEPSRALANRCQLHGGYLQALPSNFGRKGGGNADRMRFYRTRFIWDLTDNVGRAISSSDVICQIPYKNLIGRPIKSHAKNRYHRPKSCIFVS